MGTQIFGLLDCLFVGIRYVESYEKGQKTIQMYCVVSTEDSGAEHPDKSGIESARSEQVRGCCRARKSACSVSS